MTRIINNEEYSLIKESDNIAIFRNYNGSSVAIIDKKTNIIVALINSDSYNVLQVC